MNAQTGSQEATRESLVCVLAGESRNALARIELAASEIARLEGPPALRARLTTIREAVQEADSLIGKIRQMAEPSAGEIHPTVLFGDVVEEVCQRVRGSVAARGIVLDGPASGRETTEDLPVAIPRGALEQLILGLLRPMLSLGGEPNTRIRVEVLRAGDRARYVVSALRGRDLPRFIAFDRETRLELEVGLAEWNGRLLGNTEPANFEFGFELPLGARDD